MYIHTEEREAGDQHCRKRAGDLAQWQVEYESWCPGSQEAQPFSVGHQAQPGKGEDGCALLCTGVALPQVLGAVLGATI